MILRLEQESATESDRKSFCDTELRKTATSQEDREGLLASVATKLEKATAELAAHSEELDDLSQQIRKLVTSQGQFESLRQEEKADHESSIAFLQQALAATQRALQVLNEYYATGEEDGALPQADLGSSMTAGVVHPGSTGPGVAIIKLIEMTNSDFAKNLGDLQEEEYTEATKFAQWQKEQLILRSNKEAALKQCSEDRNSLQKSLTELKADQASAQDELDAVEEYLQQLKLQCQAFVGSANVSYEHKQAQAEESYHEKKRRRELEETGLREALQVLSAMNEKSESKASEWKVAVRLGSGGGAVEENIGKEQFNALFARCPVVRYLRDGAVHSVYVRTTPTGPVNAYELFTFDWTDVGNVLHTDFEMYDGLEDAQLGESRWQFCTYGDVGAGYPGNCGKSGEVSGLWFSMPGSSRAMQGIAAGASLEIYVGESCPSDQTSGQR
jgi:hypothetical protein